MSTAQELQMKLDEVLPMLNAVGKVVAETLSESAMLRISGREVCARRASKLRKRGHLVRWVSTTTNGKNRYLWMPRWQVTPNVDFSRGGVQSGEESTDAVPHSAGK